MLNLTLFLHTISNTGSFCTADHHMALVAIALPSRLRRALRAFHSNVLRMLCNASYRSLHLFSWPRSSRFFPIGLASLKHHIVDKCLPPRTNRSMALIIAGVNITELLSTHALHTQHPQHVHACLFPPGPTRRINKCLQALDHFAVPSAEPTSDFSPVPSSDHRARLAAALSDLPLLIM